MKWHLLIIICFLLLGCSNGSSKIEVLPGDKMARVMWDMIQVDELATQRLIKDTAKNPKMERIELYEKVFGLHKTSKEQFSKSYSYYSSHPDLMKALFDSLNDRGARERKTGYISRDSIPK